MRRFINDLTDEGIIKKLNKGYGLGIDVSYIPWLGISNVSSKGRSARVFNPKNRKKVICFSDLESRVCIKLIWNDDVVDIREQFPLLPRCETQEIAKQLGVRHPRAPKAKNDLVMTTDFLVTVRRGNKYETVAIYVKYETDLEGNQRNKEKLLIEKKYWEKRGVKLLIASEKYVPKLYACNISRLLTEYNYPIPEVYSEEYLLRVFTKHILTSNNQTVSSCVTNVAALVGLEKNDVWKLLYRFMAHKQIPALLKEAKLVGTSKIKEVIDIDKLQSSMELREESIYENNA